MSKQQQGAFGEADHLTVLGAVMSITADGESTDGAATVVDMLAPPGFENGLHTHEPAEVFHVIEGELALHVDGETEVLGPGMSGFVPGGTPHGFRVTGDDVCRVVLTLTPAGSEAFFRAVGDPVDGRDLPEPREPTEAELRELFAVGEQYGFEFLGPLPA